MNKWIGLGFLLVCLVTYEVASQSGGSGIQVPPRGYNIATSSGTNSIMDGSLSVSNDIILKGGRVFSTAVGGGDVDIVQMNTLQICIDTTWTNINFIYNGNNDYLGLSVRGLTPFNSGVLNLGTNAHIYNQIWANQLLLQGLGITNTGWYNGASGWTQYVGGVEFRTVVTNALQTYAAASSFNYSNIVLVTRGQSSNVVVGGTWFRDATAYTNVSATPTVFTNIGQIVIPSNMLTNNGDVVKGYWKISQRLATPGTNEFKFVGTNSSGNTYLDTGLQMTSNGIVYAYIEAERINANTIAVVASVDWNGTQGRVFDRTNGVNRTYVLDTGTNNTFALQVAAQAVISVTNISLRATYEPAPF